MIVKVVKEAGTDVVSGFMDGSCRGNPGPFRAGACLFFFSQERIDFTNRSCEVFFPSKIERRYLESFIVKKTVPQIKFESQK